MAIQDITLTAGESKNEDFIHNGATTNDKVMVVIYSAGGAILVKNSAANGGSADQIEITASTKYTLKLTPADTILIPNNATYKLFLIPETETQDMVLYGGTITVNSASTSAPPANKAAQSYSYDQYFTENGRFDFDLPAKAYIEKIILEDLAGPVVTIDIGISGSSDEIIEGMTVGGGTDIVDCILKQKYFNSVAATPIYVSSTNWNSGGIMVTIVWKEL